MRTDNLDAKLLGLVETGEPETRFKSHIPEEAFLNAVMVLAKACIMYREGLRHPQMAADFLMRTDADLSRALEALNE